MRAEILIDVAATLGEGPRWDAERSGLLCVDIEPGEGGGILVALADRLAFVGEDGAIRGAHPIPHSAELRMNDGACDARGRFWVGSMRLDERGWDGALYRYDGRELVTVLDGVGLSNGIGWSPDGTLMYYVDTL